MPKRPATHYKASKNVSYIVMTFNALSLTEKYSITIVKTDNAGTYDNL